MKEKWILNNNHIAIESEDCILHPNAEEVFALLSGESIEGLHSPEEDLTEIRFSKIGSSIKCQLFLNEKNEICIDVYAIRKKKHCVIDVVEGHILDHGLCEKEWFYINNDTEELQELFEYARINSNGIISIGQYLDLMKHVNFSESKIIENKVDNQKLSLLSENEKSVPKSITASLYEYQRIGYSWISQMLDYNHGCILGDEMGLGKTLQIITVFQELKEKYHEPALVVAPVSLLANWKQECKKFAPNLDVYIHHGQKRTGRYQELSDHDVIVISYSTAISDLSMLKMINWQCVVLDEAQNIKNPNSERAKAVKSLRRKGSVAVTGTPFENHVTDIWSIVDFVEPGLLGSLSVFTQNITDDVLGGKKIEPIISPIMIRRLVKDVANDLPEKVIIPQPIIMSEMEKEQYEELRKEALQTTENGRKLSLPILQKLRMFCTHPSICDETETLSTNPGDVSIKYQRLCDIVEEIINTKEKVIVFTSYKKMFDIFSDDITNRFGIKVRCINGDTPVESRQKIVEDFNASDKSEMLVLNPRAAGTGLNITGANHVIHYNLEWNPSLEDQASARAYRRGQEKTDFVYRLYYADTVEQIVNERIENKREIASTAIIGNDGINDKNDILRALQMAPEIRKDGI